MRVFTTAGEALLVVFYHVVRLSAEWFSAGRIRALVFLCKLRIEIILLLLNGIAIASFQEEIYGNEQRTNDDDNAQGLVDAGNESHAHTEHREYALQLLAVGRLCRFCNDVKIALIVGIPDILHWS